MTLSPCLNFGVSDSEDKVSLTLTREGSFEAKAGVVFIVL